MRPGARLENNPNPPYRKPTAATIISPSEGSTISRRHLHQHPKPASSTRRRRRYSFQGCPRFLVLGCLPYWVLWVCANTSTSTSALTTRTFLPLPQQLQQQQQPPPSLQTPLINTHGFPSKPQPHLLKKTSTSTSASSTTTTANATTTNTTATASKENSSSNTTYSNPQNSNRTLIPQTQQEQQQQEGIQTNDVQNHLKEEKEEETASTTTTSPDESSNPIMNNKNTTPDDDKFRERIESSIRTVQNWETLEWLQECRTIIPWQELTNSTGMFAEEQDRMIHDPNALLLQRLCRWFPKQFMSWVNTPPCSQCGCNECEMKTVRGPETQEEHEGNAKRVEVYYCPECKANTTTFPRYNKARKLLETKKGRCGEYSNLFGLFCRAAGFETRLVLDWTDHLWTEVRIGDHWIMADSCEGIIDKPSMYEYGWGKDGLCYIMAIAADHVVDVTPKYTRRFMTDDLQTRRRMHTTSENATTQMLRELNEKLQQTLPESALEELNRRRRLEEAELQLYQQAREWTPQEKYGRGRISGSLVWKQRRQEDGTKGRSSDDGDYSKQGNPARDIPGFEMECFSPPWTDELSLCIRPKPSGRHDGILVAGTACAMGEADSISVVVVDEQCLGCILQSKSFITWEDTKEFLSKLPPQRIVLMNGKCEVHSKISSADLKRLGGWIGAAADKHLSKSGIAFIGQLDAHPDWAYCSSLEDCPMGGYEVILKATNYSRPELALKTERHARPAKVAGRLPESAMPMKTQLVATEEQKRLAFLSFTRTTKFRYAGYTSRPGAPIYLLDSDSYPISRMDSASLSVATNQDTWNTFLYVPKPLVPDDDNCIQSSANASSAPSFEIPLEISFFNHSLGPLLLSNEMEHIPTEEALHNARLVGYYFSAHWCGPCRSFTPMLAEMYAHLKEERPTHGLEIVFVSGDRDANSFSQYFSTMPWFAVPFDHLQAVKSSLNATYAVRGIPSLVILDAVSGHVIASANETRQSVAMACRGGEKQIESLLDVWLQRVPQETTEILSMLEISCQEEESTTDTHEEQSNPYLLVEKKPSQSLDNTAARIKEFFEKLVAEGSEPTTAAAKAIGLVAEEQKTGKLTAGKLNGMATRTGPMPTKVAVDHYLNRAIEWNSAAAVQESLETMLKYLKNSEKEPWSPKFRSFKLSNKVADKMTRMEGGLRLLDALGFEIFATSQDFQASIPISMDFETTRLRLTQLLDELNNRK